MKAYYTQLLHIYKNSDFDLSCTGVFARVVKEVDFESRLLGLDSRSVLLRNFPMFRVFLSEFGVLFIEIGFAATRRSNEFRDITVWEKCNSGHAASEDRVSLQLRGL